MARPPKFKSPEEMEGLITAYFADCEAKEKMPTKAGLALALDCHKDTLSEYVNNKGEEFSDAIKKAYTMIEEAWTSNLTKNNAVGSIFYLKAACGYRDRVDVTTNEKDMPSPILPLHELRTNHSHEEVGETEETD